MLGKVLLEILRFSSLLLMGTWLYLVIVMVFSV